MEYKSPEELRVYEQTKSEFTPFVRFRDENAKRVPARQEFIDGKEYVPRYAYPGLDTLLDIDDKGNSLSDKKTKVYEAVLELRAHVEAGDTSSEEYEQYANYHEKRLKGIMLTEAAMRLRRAGSSSEQEVARQDFIHMNMELHGEMSTQSYEAMMCTEAAVVDTFVPTDEYTSEIKTYLDSYFARHTFEAVERPLLDDEAMRELSDFIDETYTEVFAVVPETDDTVRYDAETCREIMQQALVAGELAEKGWLIEISSKHANVTTSVAKKKIYIPDTMTRSAAELKRLIMHEQEVHARRGQNGDEAGVKLLKNGTADCADVEEGLGVLMECAVAGNLQNPSFDRARDRYIVAGLALGLDGIPKDAHATFDIMWRLLALRNATDGRVNKDTELAAKNRAMDYVDNAFRGTNYGMPGIIYTKLKTYYEGLEKNAAYITQHRGNLKEAFTTAMIGKYNHTDHSEVEQIQTVIAQAV